jgi:hypothetical protein
MKNIWLDQAQDRTGFTIQLLTKNAAGVYTPRFPGWFPGPSVRYSLPMSKEDFKEGSHFRVEVDSYNADKIYGFYIINGENRAIYQEIYQKPVQGIQKLSAKSIFAFTRNLKGLI